MDVRTIEYCNKMRIENYLFIFFVKRVGIPQEVIEKYIEPYHYPPEEWSWWENVSVSTYETYDWHFVCYVISKYKEVFHKGACWSCPCICGYRCICKDNNCWHLKSNAEKALIITRTPIFNKKCSNYKYCYDPLCKRCSIFTEDDEINSHYYELEDEDINRCTTFELKDHNAYYKNLKLKSNKHSRKKR